MRRIVVCQRGWVVVGFVEQNGDELVITNGAVIRKWGTSKGLPEIASRGPLSETVLDASSTPIRVHKLAVVFQIDCNSEAWPKHV